MISYDKIDLASLIESCRGHDDGAFSELVRRYTPMLHKVIAGFEDACLSSEELFAEACIGLHYAAQKFDLIQTGVTFGLYARICVYNRIVDLIRRETRPRELAALDTDIASDDGRIDDGIVSRETADRLITAARDLLSDYEYRVLILHTQGYKTAQIAVALGRDAKSVDNAKNRLFRRLRAELDGLRN